MSVASGPRIRWESCSNPATAERTSRNVVALRASGGSVPTLDSVDLGQHLDRWARRDPARADVAIAIMRLAEACRQISCLVGRGALAGALGAETGKQTGADPQKDVDVRANDLIVTALKGAPVATLASE